MKNVLELNAKLQNNLEYLVDAHNFLIKNVIRLEDDLEQVKREKMDLETRIKIIDNVNDLDDSVHDTHDMGFDDSAASTSEIKPITAARNQKKKMRLSMTPKLTNIGQDYSNSIMVPKVIPFKVYRHKLTQPFWCEYCEKQGHLREYCRLAIEQLPKYIPTKPELNPHVPMDKRKATTSSSSIKNGNKKNKCGKKKDYS